MLKAWNANKKNNNCIGFLSNEIYIALTHTIQTIPLLIDYCLNFISFDYILLGKFQTDALERRFGHYRQMSGSQYLVSIYDIINSEKKIKIKKLLNLYSKNNGQCL